MSAASTDYKDLYLSFRGRASRSTLWLYMVLPFFLIEFGFMFTIIICGALGVSDTLLIVLNILFAVIMIALIWPFLAILIKRWHDRDKSGWWVLIGFVPVIGPIWALIETGFLPGTDGPNRFGDDPRQRQPVTQMA